MKWKLVAVVLLLAVGLGTAGYVVLAPGGNARAQSQYLTATVSRANVTQQVVATGSVRSAATYNLAFGSDPVLSTGTAADVKTGSNVEVQLQLGGNAFRPNASAAPSGPVGTASSVTVVP